MLKVLRNHNRDESQRLISAVIQSLLPDPGIEPTPERTEEQQQVLQEVLDSLRIKNDDKSGRSQAQIFDYLSNELQSYALKGKDVQSIKARLAEKHSLPNHLFEVAFIDGETEALRSRGIDTRQVIETIHSPDTFEQLIPEAALARGVDPVFIFAKRYGGRNEAHAYILLVRTFQQGAVQTVTVAHAVYLSDVPIANTDRPLDILRAFIDVYGLEFSLLGLPSTNFVQHQMISTLRHQPPPFGWNSFEIIRELFAFSSPAYEGRPTDHVLSYRVGELGTIEISVAYFINLTKYFADLQKHGVKAKAHLYHNDTGISKL
ncbi:MAG: hypothetical protein JO316_02045 [Abitibacteriaceae bacterium]|nr:hypothetical protein [Abditibacteriaceae bacterium]